jgi:hypothetical protein
MSLVAGTRWSFQRIRVQIDRRPRIGAKYEGDRRLLPQGESARLRRHCRYLAEPAYKRPVTRRSEAVTAWKRR